jgi:hypothetical protein
MQGTDSLEKRRRLSCCTISGSCCSSPEQGLSFELDNQGCVSKGWRRREPIKMPQGMMLNNHVLGQCTKSATKVFLCYHKRCKVPETKGFYNTTPERPPS